MANIIPNPSFETDTSGWDLQSAYIRTNDDAQDGSYSIKYTGTQYENMTTSGSDGLTVLPATSYTLTFYYKGVITAGNSPTVTVNRDSAYGTTLASQYMGANASWTQKTINFFVPTGVTKIWIRIYGGAGTVVCHFDNFIILEPTTGGNTLYRGLNASGLEFGSSFPGTDGIDYFQSTNSFYAYAAGKGSNIMRIPIRWERIQPDLNASLNSIYKSQLDEEITKCTNNGMKVVLDVHNYQGRNVTTAGGFTDTFGSASVNFSGNYSISGGVLSAQQWNRITGGTLLNPVSPATSYKVTVDAKITSNGGSDVWRAFWIEVFRTDDNNKYFFTMSNLGSHWEVYKVVTGVQTLLASGTATFALNTGYTIILDVGQTTPGSLIVKIAGSTVATVALDAGLTGGVVSFYGNGVNWSIDNFTLDVAGDTSDGGTTAKTIGDGTLTSAHFADLWTKLSTAYKNNTTVIAYDLMNEFHDMPVGTTSSNYKTTATATVAYQAAVTAIRGNGDTKYCIVELDAWAGIQNFITNYGSDPDPWITDASNKIIYSGHYYMDSDHSGSYSGGWDGDARLTNLHEEVIPFLAWCNAHNVLGFIGEFGTPSDDDRWLSVLYTFYKYLDDYNIWGATYWAAGDAYTSTTSIQPSSSYSVDARQMSVVKLFPGGDHIRYVGGTKLKFQGIDVMTWCKDSVRGSTDAHGGYTLAQIDSWMSLVAQMGATHVAISVPLDTAASYPSGQSVDPAGGIGYMMNWIDKARKYGLSVLHRGTFIEFEAQSTADDTVGLYGSTRKYYPLRVPGTKTQLKESLTSDTWLKKVYDFVVTNGNTAGTYGRLIEENDILAFYPEPTSFQFTAHPTWQNNTVMSQFYFDMKVMLDVALSVIGRRGVYTGYSSCTETEIASGYTATIYYQAALQIAIDHYDTNPTTWMSTLATVFSGKSFLGADRKMFIQEFGDIYSSTEAARAVKVEAYVTQIDNNLSMLSGVSYWAAPVALINPSEFTLTKSGRIFRDYFKDGLITDGGDAPHVDPPPPSPDVSGAWHKPTIITKTPWAKG